MARITAEQTNIVRGYLGASPIAIPTSVTTPMVQGSGTPQVAAAAPGQPIVPATTGPQIPVRSSVRSARQPGVWARPRLGTYLQGLPGPLVIRRYSLQGLSDGGTVAVPDASGPIVTQAPAGTAPVALDVPTTTSSGSMTSTTVPVVDAPAPAVPTVSTPAVPTSNSPAVAAPSAVALPAGTVVIPGASQTSTPPVTIPPPTRTVAMNAPVGTPAGVPQTTSQPARPIRSSVISARQGNVYWQPKLGTYLQGVPGTLRPTRFALFGLGDGTIVATPDANGDVTSQASPSTTALVASNAAGQVVATVPIVPATSATSFQQASPAGAGLQPIGLPASNPGTVAAAASVAAATPGTVLPMSTATAPDRASPPSNIDNSVSAQMQRRSQGLPLLQTDGVPLFGDYYDAIRKGAGYDIRPPQVPHTGSGLQTLFFPNSKGYVGATLAGTPGALLAGQPISNFPRRYTTAVASPSVARRRALRSLMGLGDADDGGGDDSEGDNSSPPPDETGGDDTTAPASGGGFQVPSGVTNAAGAAASSAANTAAQAAVSKAATNQKAALQKAQQASQTAAVAKGASGWPDRPNWTILVWTLATNLGWVPKEGANAAVLPEANSVSGLKGNPAAGIPSQAANLQSEVTRRGIGALLTAFQQQVIAAQTAARGPIPASQAITLAQSLPTAGSTPASVAAGAAATAAALASNPNDPFGWANRPNWQVAIWWLGGVAGFVPAEGDTANVFPENISAATLTTLAGNLQAEVNRRGIQTTVATPLQSAVIAAQNSARGAIPMAQAVSIAQTLPTAQATGITPVAPAVTTGSGGAVGPAAPTAAQRAAQAAAASASSSNLIKVLGGVAVVGVGLFLASRNR